MSASPERQAELLAEFEKLSAAIKNASCARDAWVEKHIAEIAKYQVGDELFNKESCQRVGVVTRIFVPYWELNADGIEYEYDTGEKGMFGGNIKRTTHFGVTLGSNTKYCGRDEMAADLRARADILSRGTSS